MRFFRKAQNSADSQMPGLMKEYEMINDKGFTLIELVVTMGIFVIVMAVAGKAFNVVLQNATSQSKMAETNIEGVLGLEILRKDIANAGFGLLWSFENSATLDYDEAASTEVIAAVYNSTPNVPRAVTGGNNLNPGNPSLLLQGTDYLVIRATDLGDNQAAQRWSYMYFSGSTKPTPVPPVVWPKDNLEAGDNVIVLRVDLTGGFSKELLIRNNAFFTTFGNLSAFEPLDSRVIHYIYGINNSDGSHSPTMPFNRADYFVRFPGADNMPDRCAPNTGVLFKATVNQGGGQLREMPLLDCVADMQVVYLLDSTTSGTMTSTDDISTMTPREIREQLKSVEVYILTHEGGRDRNMSYPNPTIQVGPGGLGRNYDLQTTIGDDFRNYRWKVYQMTVKLSNTTISTQ